MDFSFQKKKNGLENCFMVPEVLNKYKRSFFLDTLYVVGINNDNNVNNNNKSNNNKNNNKTTTTSTRPHLLMT